uniref:Uncharacterized protein n=1 Tax=Mimivirus LCMiAC01 TaxID=2506608 RepID=A0A481Z0M7_9VIRU|nr:MAG: hypothetical protein LCMiAC01_03130 [Mimivirus LCMiAC01]
MKMNYIKYITTLLAIWIFGLNNILLAICMHNVYKKNSTTSVLKLTYILTWRLFGFWNSLFYLLITCLYEILYRWDTIKQFAKILLGLEEKGSHINNLINKTKHMYHTIIKYLGNSKYVAFCLRNINHIRNMANEYKIYEHIQYIIVYINKLITQLITRLLCYMYSLVKKIPWINGYIVGYTKIIKTRYNKIKDSMDNTKINKEIENMMKGMDGKIDKEIENMMKGMGDFILPDISELGANILMSSMGGNENNDNMKKLYKMQKEFNNMTENIYNKFKNE